jgi:GNAT superfamily N-acetyltransferase
MSSGAVTETTVRVEPDPDPADVRAVHAGLRAYNVAHLGEPNEVPVHVFLRDTAGLVVGGLTGHVKWKWLYVQKLWVDDRFRSQGGGRRLMEAAEQFARERGATDAYLDTFEYQARPFYERLGYTLFGTLEGHPPGYRQYFLTKALRDPRPTSDTPPPSPGPVRRHDAV